MRQRVLEATPYLKDYYKRFLSTEPADYNTWERAARKVYEYLHIPWPSLVIRVRSPNEGLRVIASLEDKNTESEDERIDLWESIAIFAGSSGDQDLYNPIREALKAHTLKLTSFQFSGLGCTPTDPDDYYETIVSGFLSARDLHTVMKLRMLGVDGGMAPAIAETLETSVSTVGGWWPGLQYVVVCDRPAKLSYMFGSLERDFLHEKPELDNPVYYLHSDNAPAVVWQNGEEVFYFQGIPVSKELFRNRGVRSPRSRYWTPRRVSFFGWGNCLSAFKQELQTIREGYSLVWLLGPGPDYAYVYQGEDWTPTWYEQKDARRARLVGHVQGLFMDEGTPVARVHGEDYPILFGDTT